MFTSSSQTWKLWNSQPHSFHFCPSYFYKLWLFLLSSDYTPIPPPLLYFWCFSFSVGGGYSSKEREISDSVCLYGLTQGTHGVKSTAVILSTCFKSAGCQPEMSSKPNLIDIMPYTAASSNEESKILWMSKIELLWMECF